MAKLAISRQMLGEFARLPHNIQRRVQDLAAMFHRMTVAELNAAQGIHLEPYRNGRDPRARTIRITLNHRGIVMDLGDNHTFVLIRILPHDEADAWMMRNVCRVNEATGALEIVDVVAVEKAVADGTRAAEGAPEQGKLFAHRGDDEFAQLGVDPELLPVLRLLPGEDHLMALLANLPRNQAEALILLTGHESVHVLFGQIAGDIDPAAIDTEDLAAALDAPASHADFHVVRGQDDLEAMLALPLAQWRTYLHASQEALALRPSFSGPVRVTGGAGTGKTVVAMHRARFLADRDPLDGGARRILFTTFTRNLAQSISRDLQTLGGAGLTESVEVLNVDALAARVVKDAEGRQPGVIAGDELSVLWQDLVDANGIDLAVPFLLSEWEQVILAQGCVSQADYFKASRAGRGIRLDRRGRAKVWSAVELLNRELAGRGQRTFLQIAQAAAGYLAARPIKPYGHIVVDEAQDLHEQQWRLLRQAVAPGPDDLFIVGDSHQRIYDRRSSLSKVGINIVGRSHRLRINYRTTHEILAWALSLLGEGDFDDLDAGPDNHDFAGYHSLLHGSPPELSGSRTRQQMQEALTERVLSWIDQGIAPEDIGIAVRSGFEMAPLRDVVTRRTSQAVQVLGRELDTGAGIRIGTMHRMKGLEFRCVALVGVDDGSVPQPNALADRSADEVQHRTDLQRELCLLYVACTRAREHLWVGWSGIPSRFLGPVLRSDN